MTGFVRSFILFFFFFCHYNKSQAQEFTRIYEGENASLFRMIKKSSVENAYYTIGQHDTDWGSNGLLCKLDINGNIIWSVELDRNLHYESIDEVIDPATKQPYLVATGTVHNFTGNSYTFRINAQTGVSEWRRMYDHVDNPFTISTKNSVYLVATSRTTSASYGITVHKLKPDGTLQWTKNFRVNNSNTVVADLPAAAENGLIAIPFSNKNNQNGVLVIDDAGTFRFARYSNVARSFKKIRATKDGFLCSYVYDNNQRQNNHGFLKLDFNGNTILKKRIYSNSPFMGAATGPSSVIETSTNKIIYTTISGMSGKSAYNYIIMNTQGELIEAKESESDSLSIEFFTNLPNGLIGLTASTIKQSECEVRTTNSLLSVFKETNDMCVFNNFSNLIVEDDPMILLNATTNSFSYSITAMTISANSKPISMRQFAFCTNQELDLGQDEYACTSDPITLNAGSGFKTYLWNTGATTPTIQVTTSGTYSVKVINHCEKILEDTIKVTFDPNPNKTENVTICDGQSYTVGNNTYTTSGIYTDEIESYNGCKQTVTTVLTVQNGFTKNQSFNICPGETISVAGKTYSTAGTFTDIVKIAGKCDSIYITTITLKSPTSSTLNYSICSGETVTVEGQNFNTAGTFTVKTINHQGCDSTITVNISISSADTLIQVFNICPGETISVAGKTYSTAGTFTDIVKIAGKCDSVYITTITLKNHSSSNLNYKICSGETVTVEGENFNTAGTFTVKTTNHQGCDSTITVNISISSADTLKQAFSICPGKTVFVAGKTYSTAGTFTDIVKIAGKCDSIYITTITLKNHSSSNLNYKICSGETVTVEGENFNTAGTFTVKTKNHIGCDSIIHIEINVLTPTYFNQSITLCEGDVYVIGDDEFSDEGKYTTIIQNHLGCDSIVETNISIIPKFEWNTISDTTICIRDTLQLNAHSGDHLQYLWNTGATTSSIEINQAGTYFVQAYNECQSEEQEIMIEEKFCSCDIYFPNAFSPNGDGIHDTFRPITQCNPDEYHLQIFDRWGRLVFETYDIRKAWNGLSKDNTSVIMDTYIWHIQYEHESLKGRKKVSRNGHVTLIQ